MFNFIHTIPYHTYTHKMHTYHTIPYHTIPYHTISYHTKGTEALIHICVHIYNTHIHTHKYPSTSFFYLVCHRYNTCNTDSLCSPVTPHLFLLLALYIMRHSSTSHNADIRPRKLEEEEEERRREELHLMWTEHVWYSCKWPHELDGRHFMGPKHELLLVAPLQIQNHYFKQIGFVRCILYISFAQIG